MSKKVLSLALVVVMLMSMFAFSTSAVDLSAGQVAVKVVSDAVVGAPAGTVVTVKAYYVLPAGETDKQMAIGNTAIGYDNTAFSVDTSTFAWGSTYANYFKLASNTCNAASTISNNIVKKFGAADTANGWNAALQVQQVYEGSTYTKNTGYPVDVDCEIFTLQFTALKEIEADDVIGVVVGAYGQSFFKVNAFDEAATTKYATYDVADVNLTEGVAVPTAAAKAPVYHVANQVRPNGDAMDIGIKAGFNTEDIAIAFDANGTSTNVAKVGANLKVNGTDAGTGTSRFVYKISDTEYQYRVIIEGVAKDSTDVYTVELFVEMSDGTIITGDTVEVKAADVVGKLPA